MNVYVEMTEEEIARRWASKNGMCLIDWNTLENMRKFTPLDLLIYDVSGNTYKLSELGKALESTTEA